MADFELPDTMHLRPSRRPVVGNAEFRSAMAAMASTVSLVTARRGDERIGRTVTSVMSLSINPPTILISIDILSRLADLIAKTGGFSFAMLADDQSEVADAFAGGSWQKSGSAAASGANGHRGIRCCRARSRRSTAR